MTKTIYTLYSYEDNEIKDVVSTREQADEWIEINRFGNEEDIRVEKWIVEFKEEAK